MNTKKIYMATKQVRDFINKEVNEVQIEYLKLTELS